MIKGNEARPTSVTSTRFHGLWVAVLMLFPGAPGIHAAPASQAGLPPEIISFIQAKENHARALEKSLELKVSPEVWDFFRTAQTGTLAAITNSFERLKKRAGNDEGAREDPTVGTPVFQTVIEVIVAVKAFAEVGSKYSMAFGQEVINSIPPGSIYFGGNGPVLGLVTALSKSHAQGEPFFTLTQNGLSDGRYLEYIRATYGERIRIPTTNESQTALALYLADAQKRLEHDRKFPSEPRQLRPGEDVKIVDNRVQPSGHVALMAINGLLTKKVFDANPDREFYVNESFPLDWMYPYLSPHGLIFKLHREPPAALSEEVVKKDREFWMRQQTQVIGGWLTPDTPVQDVCAFVEKTFGRKEFSGFEGDRLFVEQGNANKMYSKLRSSMGGLYAWRQVNSQSPEEQKRMMAEADFAFRQAFAFCPFSPETIFRYINLLLGAGRTDDAIRVATTAQSLDLGNGQLATLVSELNRLKPPKTE